MTGGDDNPPTLSSRTYILGNKRLKNLSRQEGVRLRADGSSSFPAIKVSDVAPEGKKTQKILC